MAAFSRQVSDRVISSSRLRVPRRTVSEEGLSMNNGENFAPAIVLRRLKELI
jgi:hypothetical protein